MEILILAVLGIWLFFALWYVYRHRGSSCGSCSGCSHCGECDGHCTRDGRRQK